MVYYIDEMGRGREGKCFEDILIFIYLIISRLSCYSISIFLVIFLNVLFYFCSCCYSSCAQKKFYGYACIYAYKEINAQVV